MSISRLLPLAALCLSSSAWAQTAVYIDSPPGDGIGGGQEYTFTAPETSIHAAASSAHRQLAFAWADWYLLIEAKAGAVLEPGNYNGVVRYPAPPGAANYGLALNRTPDLGCSTVEGWFEIVEATYVGPAILSLAIDFVQNCDKRGPLFGAIRINSSVPLQRSQPHARVTSPVIATEGDTVVLDGLASFDRQSTITHKWEQASGAPVELAGATAAVAGFVAPAVGPGGTTLEFALTVRDKSGNVDEQTVAVEVHDVADPRTRAFLDSPYDELVGFGETYWHDEADTRIDASVSGSVLTLSIDGNVYWRGNFALPAGAVWQPGLYAGAGNYPFQSPNQPGLRVSCGIVPELGYTCAESSGWFKIVEIEIVGGTVTRLALDFQQHCQENVRGLFGAIRINSSVPVRGQGSPYAFVPTPGDAAEGETVTLDGSASSGEGALSYRWTQIGGTPVALDGANSPVATFTAPSVAPGGDALTFELRLTNGEGVSSTRAVTAQIASIGDPRTLVFVDGAAWLDEGFTQTFVAPTARISSQRVAEREMVVRFDGWEARLRAPVDRTLVAGNYEATGHSLKRPGLSVASPRKGCDSVGWFEIYEAAFLGSEVKELAADMTLRCKTVAGEKLFAAIRINSAVPLQRPQPYARVVGPGVVTEGDMVVLEGNRDGTLSFHRSAGAIASWQWTQLEGPTVTLTDDTTSNPSFMAPPVPPGGQTLRFRLTVTAGGYQDSTVVDVRVHDIFDPRTRGFVHRHDDEWRGGDWTQSYDESNTLIDARLLGGALQGDINGDDHAFGFFAPPEGSALGLGTYPGALRHVWQERPGLDFYAAGCSSIGGWHEVVDLQVIGTTVISAAVDFLQKCEGGVSKLFGAFRKDSSVPLHRNVPYAIAGLDQAVQEGTPVTLDGSESWSPVHPHNALTYFWRQTSGPAATIVNPTTATPSITFPTGGGDFRFELQVVDGPGRVDVDDVRVLVRARSELQTYLKVDADPGESIGLGLRRFFSTDTAGITVSRNNDQGVSIGIDDGDHWALAFAGPDAAPLQPGTYASAERFPSQSAGLPGLSWSGVGRDCTFISGQFRVFRITYNPDNSVQSAAIDFEQHCNGQAPAARGKLRINFAPDNEPLASAGQDQKAADNASITLDGSGSGDLQGPITYAWRQTDGRAVTLNGTTTAQPSFMPLPVQDSLEPEMYTFVLTVTDAEGFTSEDSVAVEVYSLQDSDSDGVVNAYDAFPNDPTEQNDADGDGHGDNSDAFPLDPTAWAEPETPAPDGGGGAVPAGSLILLALLGGLRRRRRA